MASQPKFPATVASIAYVDTTGANTIQVFVSDGYTVTDKYWSAGGWVAGDFSQSGHQVSALAYNNGTGWSIRVYCIADDKLTEYGRDNGGTWYVGGYSYP